MNQHIYADNAATTKLDNNAFQSMIPWLTEEYGNASQPYSFARKPKKALDEARQIIANAINATPEEIFFTSGGTESDNWAIKGSTCCKTVNKSIIITSEIEHHAVLSACETVKQQGNQVVLIRPDENGIISAHALEQVISNQTRLVSIMLSNNEIGTIEPIAELAKLSHLYGATFHTDAVQAIGHIAVDVNNLGVDLLSASAHKFNGPKGIGFLYVRKGTELLPYLDGGAQEKGFRAGTENIASIVGMAVALQNNCKNLADNQHHMIDLETALVSKLTGLDFVRNGAHEHIPGTISLSFRGISGEALLHRMDLKGISISTGSACDGSNNRVSHVIESIGVPAEYARGTVRISFGRDNTLEEAVIIADALRAIVPSLQTLN